MWALKPGARAELLNVFYEGAPAREYSLARRRL
jgi:hypothetical protein